VDDAVVHLAILVPFADDDLFSDDERRAHQGVAQHGMPELVTGPDVQGEKTAGVVSDE
jgi:hypothetical protein